MKNILFIIACFCVSFVKIYSQEEQSADLSALEQPKQKIIFQNRILVVINDKSISLLDVIKRMDFLIDQYSPLEGQSFMYRYQFYASQWRAMLNRMIDEELMLMDGLSRGIHVSDGEVRQELQHRFGSHVVSALAKSSLSYEEAWRFVYQDIVVQKIYWLRVYGKCLQKINPDELKRLYSQYLKENPPKEEVKYQILTIDSQNMAEAEALTEKILTSKDKFSSDLSHAFNEFKEAQNEAVSIRISQDLSMSIKDLSPSYREVLSHLKENDWGKIVVPSHVQGESTIRIFCLKERKMIEPSPFSSMEKVLKDGAFQVIVDKEAKEYLKFLRKKFHFHDSCINMQDMLNPFSLS